MFLNSVWGCISWGSLVQAWHLEILADTFAVESSMDLISQENCENDHYSRSHLRGTPTTCEHPQSQNYYMILSCGSRRKVQQRPCATKTTIMIVRGRMRRRGQEEEITATETIIIVTTTCLRVCVTVITTEAWLVWPYDLHVRPYDLHGLTLWSTWFGLKIYIKTGRNKG